MSRGMTAFPCALCICVYTFFGPNAHGEGGLSAEFASRLELERSTGCSASQPIRSTPDWGSLEVLRAGASSFRSLPTEPMGSIRFSQAQDQQLKELDERIHEAREKFKKGEVKEALEILKQARNQGGDTSSLWHSTYGMIGFYIRGDPAVVKGSLKRALALDPKNREAKHYLGRILARENFAAGKIIPQMGLSEADAIKVDSISQEYEYMKLFEVRHLKRETDHSKNLDIFNCETKDGKKITYYFDFSGAYEE